MKTYFVAEKLSIYKEFLKRGLIHKTDNIDFTGPVFDTAEEFLPFFKHLDGKWYNSGKETFFTEVKLPNVPENRFIGVDYRQNDTLVLSKQSDGTKNEAKYIYFVACGKYHTPYLPDLVAALHHMEYVGADKTNCFVQLYDIEYNVVSDNPANIMDMLENNLYLFEEIPVVNVLRKLCSQAKMPLKEFSDYFGIKYRTVQNWAEGINKMPEWALPLFELKLMTDGKI